MKQQTCVCCVYRLLCFFLASSQSPWHSLLLIKATAWLTRLHCPNSNVILLRFVSEPLTKWTHQKTASTFQIGTTRFGSVFTSPNGWRETVCGYFCVWVFSVAEEETQPVAERCRTKNALERERGNHGLIRLPQATTLSFLCAHTCGSTRAPYSGQLSKLCLSFFLSFFLIKRRNI
jgi:hypothetical protein